MPLIAFALLLVAVVLLVSDHRDYAGVVAFLFVVALIVWLFWPDVARVG